jgi:hypothetical protein
MAQVIGLSLVGGAYQRGRWTPGWTSVRLDNEEVITLPESQDLLGMLSPLDEMDRRGHDTRRMRKRLDEWVKTGRLPAHNEDEPAGEVTSRWLQSEGEG